MVKIRLDRRVTYFRRGSGYVTIGFTENAGPEVVETGRETSGTWAEQLHKTGIKRTVSAGSFPCHIGLRICPFDFVLRFTVLHFKRSPCPTPHNRDPACRFNRCPQSQQGDCGLVGIGISG